MNKRIKFIGIYDYTVILTYLSLFCAVLGMVLATRQQFTGAIVCLFAAGVCDAFDGIVARTKKNRTEDEKAFGIQLDSLCDVISFGFFPVCLCYHMGVDTAVGIIIMFLFCMCAVARLAFFNVLEAKRQQVEKGAAKSYRGLPVTTVSLLLPFVYLFRSLLRPVLFAYLLHVVLLIIALLFVMDICVPKPDWLKILFGKGRKEKTTS